MIRHFLCVLICLIVSGCQAIQFSHRKLNRPNVIIFYVDDMGWKDVGYMGNEFTETPAIDALAKQAVVFQNGYANAPNCAPSRASILTGQYTPRHGIYTVKNSDRGNKLLHRVIPVQNKTYLEKDAWTLAHLFAETGYRTASIGKFHVGDSPLDYGFHINVAGDDKGGPYYGGKYFSPYDNPNLVNGPDGEYLTDRLTVEAEKFILKNKKRPFFLYLSHFGVHTPIQAKEALIKKYKAKNKNKDKNALEIKYSAMVESIDHSLNAIVELLKKEKLFDSTIFVFTSDNGGSGRVTHAKPLSGYKGSPYEGGVRVPFFIAWPGQFSPRVENTSIMATDLLPTFAEIIAYKKIRNRDVDGVSLVSLLNGKKTEKRDLFWHFPAYLQSAKNSDGIWRAVPFSSIRSEQYKLIEFLETGDVALYDLKNDISERKDISKARPDLTMQLLKRLKNWQVQTGAELPSQGNVFFDEDLLKEKLMEKQLLERQIL